MAVTADRIAVAGPNRISLLGRDGARRASRQGEHYELLSPPVADPGTGRFVFAGDGLYAMDPDGHGEWHASFDVESDRHTPFDGALAISPEGTVYASTSEAALYAFRAADGARLWKHGLPSVPAGAHRVLFGAGSALVSSEAPGRWVTRVFEARTGDPRAFSPEAGREGVAIGWASPVSGLLGFRVANDGRLTPRTQTELYAFDGCGTFRWKLPAATRPALFAPGDDLVVRLTAPDGTPSFRVYSPNGEVRSGTGTGTPVAVGRDGVVYAVRCELEPGAPAVLDAYSRIVEPLWQVPLGPGCPSDAVALTDDGTLYLLRNGPSGDEILAVQTRSPGPAESSWPMRRHDALGTSWIPS